MSKVPIVSKHIESAEDAINATILESRYTFKQVAHHLKPDGNQASAYAWLKNAINPDKDEKLGFTQVVEICRFCERYEALFFFCQECGFGEPEKLAPEDARELVQREFVQSVATLRDLLQQFETLTGEKP